MQLTLKMTQMKKNFDIANSITIALTIILFTIALFVTGFTKDLLLEAGVLLVSVKIIFMAAATRDSNNEIIRKLNEIDEKLQEFKSNEFR
jgi:hypothetical protein